MGKSGNRLMEFKQFSVRDDQCAMKVGTDALLLGAWSDIQGADFILDVGSGSGIIALMLAQRAAKAKVVLVELEGGAFMQNSANINCSPFKSRMESFQKSVQEFSLEERWAGAFDVVVSNPPFFHDKPKSPDEARNLARHDDFLSLSDLLESALRCLKPNGRIMLVWPMDRRLELFKEANSRGLFLKHELVVHGSPEHEATRFLSEWHPSPQQFGSSTRLNIENGVRAGKSVELSPDYAVLLRPYLKKLV